MKIQPCTPKQLRVLYGYSAKIMRKHLDSIADQIGKRIGHTYNVKQVKIIFTLLGPPGMVLEL